MNTTITKDGLEKIGSINKIMHDLPETSKMRIIFDASMGSAIAMAGRKVYMSRIARLMTHKASGGAWGNSDEIKELLKELEAIDEILADQYASKAGCSKEDAIKKYLNGTDMYFSADAALKEGLIDGIYDSDAKVEVPKGVKNVKALWAIYNVLEPQTENQTLILI